MPTSQTEQLRFTGKKPFDQGWSAIKWKPQDFNSGLTALCRTPGCLGASGSQQEGLFVERRGRAQVLLLEALTRQGPHGGHTGKDIPGGGDHLSNNLGGCREAWGSAGRAE